MKKLTILDENFVAVECMATKVIREAEVLINRVKTPIMGIAINESESIRFNPEFIQIKSELNPVESVNTILNKICEAIMMKKDKYSLSDVAVLSEVYQNLTNEDNSKLSAIEESTNFFGGIENITLNLEEGTIELNASAVIEGRKKFSSIRENIGNILFRLDSASRADNLVETSKSLQELALLKEFVKHI